MANLGGVAQAGRKPIDLYKLLSGGQKPSGGAGLPGGKGGGGGKGGLAPAAPGVGSFNPNSNFGFNTNDKTPFNIYGLPATQGAFNKMVLAAAQPLFQPQLQAIRTQETNEGNVNVLRNTDINSIYDQYQKDAQAAHDQLKGDLAAIQAQAPSGAATANYGAAIQSALGGQNNFAAMTGQPGVDTASAAAPYVGASEDQAIALQRLLNSGDSAALQISGGNVANVGLERKSQLGTESERHLGQVQQYGQQEQQLAAQIPGIIAKARQDLITQLQAGQGQQFQQNLANKQFGLSAKTAADQAALDKQKFGETKRVDTANITQGNKQLDQAQQKINNDAAATKAAAATALAQAQGTAQANAIKYLQGALTPSPSDYHDVTTTDASGTKRTQKILNNPAGVHYDVGSILETIVTQYGIPLDQALRMMASLGGRTNIRGVGGQTIADWANTYQARVQNRKPGTPGNIGSTVASGITNKFHF
jgi:hypothetical protein